MALRLRPIGDTGHVSSILTFGSIALSHSTETR